MIDWLEQNKGGVFGFLILITLFGGMMVYIRQPDPPPLEISAPEPTVTPASMVVVVPTPAPTDTPHPLRVYITGQVKQPDVYILPVGSIINDAIEAAGGATDEADLLVVNLAQELQDQQQITIPAKAEGRPTPKVISGGVGRPSSPQQHNSPENAKAIESLPRGKININTAGLTELTTLNGIGPALGQRIIDYRTEFGNFTILEDLMQVKGIGPATFNKVKEAITIGDN